MIDAVNLTRVGCGALLVCLTSLGGCALPASAPTQLELTSTSRDSEIDYSIVKIDARVVSHLQHHRLGFAPELRTARYSPGNALRVGDAVALTVYEAGGSSLFPPPSVVPGAAAVAGTTSVSTGASNIPPQVIERDGTIFIPFVGRRKVAGLTPGEAGRLIEQQLEGKAISPQVLVTLANGSGAAATVGGEVNGARSVSLGSRGERLLDVIAAAGGAKYPAYETEVQLVRGRQTAKVMLQTVIDDPNENIFIRPGDQIYLTRNPRTFVVMGATQRVSLYPFTFKKVSLADAIAQAGGPVDQIGDPGGIYLFRFEPWAIAKEVIGEDQIASYGSNPPPTVPVMYRLDLRDAEGYFLAQSVQIRDKDVVLISNATSTQLMKLLAIVNGVTRSVYDVTAIQKLNRD